MLNLVEHEKYFITSDPSQWESALLFAPLRKFKSSPLLEGLRRKNCIPLG